MSELHDMLLAAFQVEHKEHLESIRAILLKLEQGDGVAASADLDEMFRCAHSLKAAARVCDFHAVTSISERLETLFFQMRKGAVRPDKPVVAAIRAALNAVEDWALGVAEKRNPLEPIQALAALENALENRKSGAQIRPDEEDISTPVSRSALRMPGSDAELGVKLLAAFQIEHKEHLEEIRAILAEIVKNGVPAAGQVDEVFRRAHSLKGAARLAELHAAETLAHRLESLFARVREGSMSLDREMIRVIGLGLDAIEDWAATMVEKREPPNSAHVLQAIDRIMNGEPNEEAEPVAKPVVVEAAPFSKPMFQPVETVRVSADNLDRLLRSTGQLLTESSHQNVVARDLTGLHRQIDNLEKEWVAMRNGAAPALRQLAAMPEMVRVARYLGLVEQQVRSLARRARAVRQLHQRSSWTLRMLGGQLQQDVRRVRMVAAETVFQGFRKMMRDLARDDGKEIDFHVSGFEIEADRMVLQALKDPLMHVLRNAVSHGLELPAERQRQGKNPMGRVTLHMEVLGNRLKIMVEDDGRGIDVAKVRDVAVRRGFLSHAEAATASPEELAHLLFKAGFSTSKVVTDLSGRGMGLSVVHEAVARLQGEVELRPGKTAGTTLFLSVPLLVSTQRLLLVSCRGQTFAIPLHGIERLLRVKLSEIEMVEGKPMLLFQGQPIPVLSLASLLEMSHDDIRVEGERLPLVILRMGTKRVAAVVDALLDERDGLIKDLDGPAAQVRKLAGGILLEDGSVSLVLNIAELIRSFKPSDRVPALQKVTAAPVKTRQTVLVVDDSLTTRTLEKSILETHGYDVRIAVDGVEALAKLRSESIDLVITDVQMPRMDGFQLLEEMKKDKLLAKLPVIVVTSLSRREDQERGLALGADAYIVKRKFDHQELLDTIRQIM